MELAVMMPDLDKVRFAGNRAPLGGAGLAAQAGITKLTAAMTANPMLNTTRLGFTHRSSPPLVSRKIENPRQPRRIRRS
jgi:hypothetical protein